MAELSIMSDAWQNYLDSTPDVKSIEESQVMLVNIQASVTNDPWVVRFDNEQALTAFLLKWS